MHEGKNYRFLTRYLECGREMDLKRWELLINDSSLALEQMSDEPLVEPWRNPPRVGQRDRGYWIARRLSWRKSVSNLGQWGWADSDTSVVLYPSSSWYSWRGVAAIKALFLVRVEYVLVMPSSGRTRVAGCVHFRYMRSYESMDTKGKSLLYSSWRWASLSTTKWFWCDCSYHSNGNISDV